MAVQGWSDFKRWPVSEVQGVQILAVIEHGEDERDKLA